MITSVHQQPDQPNHTEKITWKQGKRLVTAALLIGALLANTTLGYAQASTDAQAPQPNRVFLPLVAHDANNTGEDRTGEQPAAAPDSAEVTAEDYAAILNAPVPDEVNAATVNAIFTVTKVADTNDGFCNSDCSLREAMAAAAANPTTHDQITLPAGIYKLPLGTLNMVNVSLLGAGAGTTIINGSGTKPAAILMPIVNVNSTWNQVQQVTIENSLGRGIEHLEGTLMVKNARFWSNEGSGIVSKGGAEGSAEGIYIYNSIFDDNVGTGLRIQAEYGLIDNSLFNHDDWAGMVADLDADVRVYKSTYINNGDAGLSVSNGSSIDIRYSASLFNGSGIYVKNGSEARITNSTISNNASRYFGGGIDVREGSKVELTFVTIAKNTTDKYNENKGDGGGIHVEPNPANIVTIRNSIIADNTDKSGQAHDCAGAITSGGYNLIENTTGCTISGNLSGNITGSDPKLGSLSANGATTKNHLPAQSSPAVDAVNVVYCAEALPVDHLDQRLVTRPRDGNADGKFGCDMGAVER